MRPLIHSRGVSLVELLLALLMLAALSAVAVTIVRLAARTATAAVERGAASRDQVTVWALLTTELAHAVGSDVASPTATALEFDRPVADGVVCDDVAGMPVMRGSRWSASRQPVPIRDLAIVRGAAASAPWARRGIVSVAVANCPDGEPGLRLDLGEPVTAPGAVRVVEPVRLRHYASGGRWWLGLESRTGVATLQPIAGPLPADGFEATRAGDLLRVVLRTGGGRSLALQLPLGPPP